MKIRLGKASIRKLKRLLAREGCEFGPRSAGADHFFTDEARSYLIVSDLFDRYGYKVHLGIKPAVLERDVWKPLRQWMARQELDRRPMAASNELVVRVEERIAELERRANERLG